MRYYTMNKFGKVNRGYFLEDNKHVLDYLMGNSNIFKGHTRLLVLIK